MALVFYSNYLLWRTILVTRLWLSKSVLTITSETYFTEIIIKISSLLRKISLKMPSPRWQPFCLSRRLWKWRKLPTSFSLSPLGSGAFESTWESDIIKVENIVVPLPCISCIMCSTKASSVKGLSPRPFPKMDNQGCIKTNCTYWNRIKWAPYLLKLFCAENYFYFKCRPSETRKCTIILRLETYDEWW